MYSVIMAANGSEAQFIEYLISNDFTYSVMEGCYKGIKETSFKVDMLDKSQVIELFNQAKLYNQESILLIDRHGIASLVYIDTAQTVDLGRFKPVSQSDALKQDAYTLDVNNNQYYIAS